MLRYPDMPLAYLRKVPTRTYARWSVLACLLGYSLDKSAQTLGAYWRVPLQSSETLGLSLFFLGYTALWVLLPVSLFRPEDRFYIGDDCALRARRCGEVTVLLLSMHALIVLEAIQALW